ncbi:CGNR zinc finger domain-containing protein [Bacillus sp. JCM 19034]|uniref:CGNR zinc finger domain-containing protein n=1 Tax=Bacillus sp. JCM 19034 TaxID=1481928 RepID=UPI000782A602|nr:CGNR zinc finger domain-containing protein [Bacillus sp. JCM 19034]
MQDTNKYPLLSGNISLDLVNTEVVRWGQRYDLLTNNEDVLDWLNVVKKDHAFWNEHLFKSVQNRVNEVASSILELRKVIRTEFEAIVETQLISKDFIHFLEKNIEKAPITYKLIDHKLIPNPIGEIEDVLISLIALDVLTLIEANKLTYLKRCRNPECVLLFIDVSGRRKWCSMKICGNRKKSGKVSSSKIKR